MSANFIISPCTYSSRNCHGNRLHKVVVMQLIKSIDFAAGNIQASLWHHSKSTLRRWTAILIEKCEVRLRIRHFIITNISITLWKFKITLLSTGVETLIQQITIWYLSLGQVSSDWITPVSELVHYFPFLSSRYR